MPTRLIWLAFVRGSKTEVKWKQAYFACYVASRFLVPWFAKEIRDIQVAEARTREIECRAAQRRYSMESILLHEIFDVT